MAECRELQERTSEALSALLRVWESAVRATHFFLSEKEIGRIGRYVPQALREVPHLLVAETGGEIVAFAGVNGRKLEMLFVCAERRGEGIGGQLLQYAFDAFSVDEVTVNEQNAQARGFYERMGFRAYKRSETDEQGAPYPILYLKRGNG